MWTVHKNLDQVRPTSELLVHMRVHKSLAKVESPNRAFLHTHPTELISLSHLPDFETEEKFNHVIWSMHPEVKIMVPRGIGLILYALPGSERLAQATADAVGDGRALALWQYHGIVAVAPTLQQAFDLVYIVNKAAKMVLLCRSTGIAPKGLGKPELRELVKVAFILAQGFWP